ncbi:ABC transporter permease [Candidatus Berkelbacteria bacterium]|nr:ABC transporter permease [Candidatus Berkelbacteria bacterium]
MVKIIALNTFKQLIRDKIAYSIFLLLIFALTVSYFAGTISLNQQIRLINSVMLSAFMLSVVIISLFIGANIIERERRERLLFFVLTKPISKTDYFIGKWLGVSIVIFLTFVLYVVSYAILIKISGGSINIFSFTALAYVFFEGILLTAIALTLSVWTKPILAIIVFIMLYLIGHSSSLLLTIGEQLNNFASYLLKALYYLLPNLEKFNLRNDVNYLSGYSNNEALSVIAYFVFYLILTLLIGVRVFNKRVFV